MPEFEGYIEQVPYAASRVFQGNGMVRTLVRSQ
jgi:hypothetical protein